MCFYFFQYGRVASKWLPQLTLIVGQFGLNCAQIEQISAHFRSTGFPVHALVLLLLMERIYVLTLTFSFLRFWLLVLSGILTSAVWLIKLLLAATFELVNAPFREWKVVKFLLSFVNR